ncbi:MAG: hypothetical protein ACF8AM_06585 [Rhodopirellula sp. JB055]|uniref:hypothetical protein n=1 Tax=Rhodopirellula sp. JB055 TaxID=3342846 RepID=UPI00370AA965
MRRFLVASAFIFCVSAPTADAQGVVARYRGGPGAGFGFYGPAYRTPGYLAPPPFFPAPVAVVPVGPPPVRPGSYRDPLYRYRGVAPVGPAISVSPFPPSPAVILPPPVYGGPSFYGATVTGGIEINTPGFRLSVPAPPSYLYPSDSIAPSEPVIAAYPPPAGPAFDVATQLAEGVERLAAALNTIEDGDIWWDYLQIDALRQVTDNDQVTADGSMTGEAAATIDSVARAYQGVTTSGQLGRIARLDGFAETRDALVVLSQSQSILPESDVSTEAEKSQTQETVTNEPTLAPSPEGANDAAAEEAPREVGSSEEGSIEELPAPPKIKI